MHQVCSTLNRFRPAVPLVLRVVLGGLFIWHGIDKFDVGIDMIKDMSTMWGVPAPGLTAPLTAIIEIGAGTMLVFGVATRMAAMLLSVVMIGALIYVKQDLGIISSQAMPRRRTRPGDARRPDRAGHPRTGQHLGRRQDRPRTVRSRTRAGAGARWSLTR